MLIFRATSTNKASTISTTFIASPTMKICKMRASQCITWPRCYTMHEKVAANESTRLQACELACVFTPNPVYIYVQRGRQHVRFFIPQSVAQTPRKRFNHTTCSTAQILPNPRHALVDYRSNLLISKNKVQKPTYLCSICSSMLGFPTVCRPIS